MNTSLLILALLLPLCWGWCMHWLLSRLWPVRPMSEDATAGRGVSGNHNASGYCDYQI